MVRFISAPSNNISVEDVMGYVNNYINLGDIKNVENHSKAYSVQKEYVLLTELAGNVNRDYNISADRPTILMAQGRFAKLKIFVKRVIRKCIGWYLRDLAKQQTEFNASVARYINQQMIILNQMNMEIVRLHEESKLHNAKQDTIPDEWYVDFEDKFRGDSEIIKKRLEDYLEYYKDKEKVVDLGCGRGEFLQLLSEKGIQAEGVDTNETMVKHCKEQGLNVSKQDCLEFLKKQKKESLGGIFASQLVEHIDRNTLYHLITTAYNKLEKDGVLILETVNPLTLGVFCYGFYIDPTHTIPVHPAMLRFMAEEAGFEVEPVGFLNEFPDEYKFKTNENMNSDNVTVVNKLNEQIFGAQDYYLICRKR